MGRRARGNRPGLQSKARLALGGCLAALSLAASAPSAPAAVTIGSNLGRAPDTVDESNSTWSQATLPASSAASGGVVSPVNGTVTHGRIRVGEESSPIAFRLIRPVGGGVFTGAGTSATLFPGTNATFGFDLSLPIRIGDRIGLNCILCSPIGDAGKYFISGVAGSEALKWVPSLGDGDAGRAPTLTIDYEVAINADIEPTSGFTLGQVMRNKKKGTARLTVNLPNPGELAASGNGVRASSAGHAVISKAVGAGPAALLIKAKGKKKRKLNRKGKVKLNVAVTYTPTGGNPSTQPTKLKLKKKLRKR